MAHIHGLLNQPITSRNGRRTNQHYHRRLLLGAGLGLLAAPPGRAETARSAWLSFRGRFLVQDGRVVDTGNQGVSHSEGQGYSLLLAAA